MTFGVVAQHKIPLCIPKEDYKVGDYVDVKIEDCTSATLLGTAVGSSESI